jgi:hypothetical protein
MKAEKKSSEETVKRYELKHSEEQLKAQIESEKLTIDSILEGDEIIIKADLQLRHKELMDKFDYFLGQHTSLINHKKNLYPQSNSGACSSV